MLVIFLPLFAILSTTRYYTVFLRMVVLIAKIENMLKIDYKVKTKKGRPKILAWKKDENFMIQSYLDSRTAFSTSKEFIEKKKFRGNNLLSTITFMIFISMSVFLIIITDCCFS